MKNNAWLSNLNVITNSLKGVEQLRVLVLHLAFSGQLSHSQSSHRDGNTSWERRTIESICTEITPGFACSKKEQASNGHVHLRTHNISTTGTLNRDLIIRIDPRMVDPAKASVQRGDILFNNTNSQELVGKSAIVDDDYEYGFSNHITRLRLIPGIDPSFVTLYLTFLRSIGHFSSICTRWINQAAINGKLLRQQIVPVPRLEEQKWIVAKVEELMRLCDRLKAQQQEREKLLALLSRANQTRFAEVPTLANLNRIFDETGSVSPADLRNTIRSLAVQGKLELQTNKDSPASNLLELIRQRGGSTGKLGAIDYENVPFVLPVGWEWAKLGSLVSKLGSGSTPRGGSQVYTSSGVPFLRSQNVWDDGIHLDDVVYIPLEVHKAMSGTHVRSHDILLNITGASLGRCAIVPSTFESANVSQHVTIIRLIEGECRRFVHLFLQSPVGQGMIWGRQVGMAREGLSKKVLEHFEIPIPPLAEQRRIVAKVDQLLALVDQLETQQQESENLAEAFAKACIASFAGSNQIERPEKMKAPKTELVSLVTLSKMPLPDVKALLAQLLIQNKSTLPAKALWQKSGLSIDAFYQQLKAEIAQGWIAPPAEAEMKVLEEA